MSMSFFDEMGKTVGSAARKTAEKSKELYEVTRLNFQVSAQEDIVKAAYMELGKKYYQANKAVVPEDQQAIFGKVAAALDQIEQLRKKINEVREMKTCPKCGNGVEKDAVYCSRCGEKME